MEKQQLILETLIVLSGISGAVYYVASQTTWLGPYGSASDVYHQLILISILFIAFMLYGVIILKRYGPLEEES